MSIRMMIGGDVVPTPDSFQTFSQVDGQLLQPSLKELWDEADVRLFNLECPLCDGGAPIQKCGPAMRAPATCLTGIAALHPNCVSLANNHILDYGGAGLSETKHLLTKSGIDCFGAGENLADAGKPYYLEREGLRIGIYAVCEREYSIASTDAPGANPVDALFLADRIRQIRANCDYLVVLYHGGRELYPYPSPELRRVCRRIVECGGDLVLCQHSHCVGCEETYQDGHILYGQGNFLFDVSDGGPCFETGLLVRVTLDGNGNGTPDYLPIVRSGHGAALAEGEEKKEILRRFQARSRQIAEPDFVEANYRSYAAEYQERMLKVFFSGNPALKAVNVLYGRKPSRVYGKQTLLAIRNTIQCESLRELILEGMD